MTKDEKMQVAKMIKQQDDLLDIVKNEQGEYIKIIKMQKKIYYKVQGAALLFTIAVILMLFKFYV